MALFENFPYTNMQELNLDWIIKQFKILEQSTVLSVNGQTGQVVLYQAKNVQFPDVPEENWSIIRLCDGTMRGIYFANDNTAYIVHGNDLEAIYSANNQPPYPVTSVNGSTGNVVLYPGEEVILPPIDDNTKHSWAIFRDLNNVTRGIKFKDDGTAVLMVGNQEFPVYSSNNQPPYPVSSVNGKTGTVSLFTDNDGNVTFPPVSDPNVSSWMMQRSVNGDTVGIEFNDDGTMNVIINEVPYKIYSEYDPADGFVTDPTQAIMQTTEDITGYIWGLLRDTDNGAVGFIFNNTDNTDPDMYIRYKDNNNQMQNLRLLTEGDIPSTGVYNINGKSGVVTLYASDITMSNTDNRTINQVFEDIKACIGIIENTDIAVNNISIGDYVIWKDELYTCSNTIVIGDTLSLSNLTPVTSGGLNAIYTLIKAINTKFSNMFLQRVYTGPSYTLNAGDSKYFSVSDFNITNIPGYVPCAIRGFNSGNAKCSIERVELFYQSGDTLVIENTSNTTQTGTPTIKYLWVLSDLIN